MSQFWYEAIGASGEKVSGEIEAETVATAVQQLIQQGLSIHSIQQIQVSHQASSAVYNEGVSSAEFDRKIAKLVERKSHWLPALRAMADELPAGGVRNEMQGLVKSISGDLSVTDFLTSRYAAILLPLFAVGLDESENAEFSTGGSQRLHDWLDTVSTQIENRVRRSNAWVYPVVLILLLALAGVGCLTVIVPIFKAMFLDFGLTLPAPTLLAVHLSDQLTIYWPRTIIIVAIFSVVLVAAIALLRSYSLANRVFGRFAAGTTRNLAAMSAFTSALAEFLNLKAPVPLAIRYAGLICKHPYFEQLSSDLSRDASRPALQFSPSARRWPPMLIQAMQNGENGRPNVRLLRELAALYSDRVGSRLDIGTDILPAIATFLIGISVAFLVISLFMPLVSMVTSLS